MKKFAQTFVTNVLTFLLQLAVTYERTKHSPCKWHHCPGDILPSLSLPIEIKNANSNENILTFGYRIISIFTLII